MSTLRYITESEQVCPRQEHLLNHSNDASSKRRLRLTEFMKLLPKTILKASKIENSNVDPIADLLRSIDVEGSKLEFEPYFFIEPGKTYTRNLIGSDDETYTVLLMCWNPGQYSPVHDHPCDGCWMRVVKGSIREVRYEKENDTNTLLCTSDNTFSESDSTFIDDNQGFHKIGNPNKEEIAVTIHLYCPPFKQCKIWMDLCQASNPTTINLSNYSEYGLEV